jgi:hypothetical protein
VQTLRRSAALEDSDGATDDGATLASEFEEMSTRQVALSRRARGQPVDAATAVIDDGQGPDT